VFGNNGNILKLKFHSRSESEICPKPENLLVPECWEGSQSLLFHEDTMSETNCRCLSAYHKRQHSQSSVKWQPESILIKAVSITDHESHILTSWRAGCSGEIRPDPGNKLGLSGCIRQVCLQCCKELGSRFKDPTLQFSCHSYVGSMSGIWRVAETRRFCGIHVISNLGFLRLVYLRGSVLQLTGYVRRRSSNLMNIVRHSSSSCCCANINLICLRMGLPEASSLRFHVYCPLLSTGAANIDS
jgi:hypothetical protein